MKKWSKKILKKEKGFTLIELIIVIAIIAILAAVLIPRFGNFTDDAEEAALQQDASLLAKYISMYYAGEGSFPDLDYDFSEKTLTFNKTKYGTLVLNEISSVTVSGTNYKEDYSFTAEDDFVITRGDDTATIKEDGNVEVN